MLFFIAENTNTFYIAVYGAILSTIIGGAFIYSYYLNSRIRIRVTVSNTIAIPEGRNLIEVRAANIGMRATSIDAPIFMLPHNRQVNPATPHDQSVRVPYELCAGKPDFIVRHTIESLTSRLKKEEYSGLVPFTAIVPGTGGNRYKSKKMVLDLNSGLILTISLSARLKRMLRRTFHAATPY
ncbi:MAG: hypothetical protein ACXW02_06585 [Halobacteriota archaeon]